jgi:hypothetical protein
VAPTIADPYLVETAGQLGLRLWIESAGGDTDLASSWMADRYWLVPDGEASTALIWDVAFASDEAAARFEELALQQVMAITESEPPLRAGEIRISKNRRHLCVRRPKSDCVRFFNTATAELARPPD